MTDANMTEQSVQAPSLARQIGKAMEDLYAKGGIKAMYDFINLAHAVQDEESANSVVDAFAMIHAVHQTSEQPMEKIHKLTKALGKMILDNNGESMPSTENAKLDRKERIMNMVAAQTPSSRKEKKAAPDVEMADRPEPETPTKQPPKAPKPRPATDAAVVPAPKPKMRFGSGQYTTRSASAGTDSRNRQSSGGQKRAADDGQQDEEPSGDGPQKSSGVPAHKKQKP